MESSPNKMQVPKLGIDGSIYDKKYPNPQKKLLQKVFQRFSVVFDVLNNILKSKKIWLSERCYFQNGVQDGRRCIGIAKNQSLFVVEW